MTFHVGGTFFSFFLLSTEEAKTKSFSPFKQLKLDELITPLITEDSFSDQNPPDRILSVPVALISLNTLAVERFCFCFSLFSLLLLHFTYKCVYIYKMYLFIASETPPGKRVAHNYIYVVLTVAVSPETEKLCHKMYETNLLARGWIDSW